MFLSCRSVVFIIYRHLSSNVAIKPNDNEYGQTGLKTEKISAQLKIKEKGIILALCMG